MFFHLIFCPHHFSTKTDAPACSIASDWSNQHWIVLRAGASVSVSAYKQAGAERKSDPICRKVGGGGTCMRPGKE